MSSLRLQRGAVDALVWPAEGGVLTNLRVDGRSVLAVTPWAIGVVPHQAPAVTEAQWVERWRGGWQLCFPSAGLTDEKSPWPQSFHGVASQAAWSVLSADEHHVCLQWNDRFSLTATRTWRLTDTGVRVDTIAQNDSQETRSIVIAEHLVLGGDLLAPVFVGSAVLVESAVLDGTAVLEIVPPDGTVIAMLDYSGHPLDEPVPWPGRIDERWSVVDRDTPARVAALVEVEPRSIVIRGSHAEATVSWHGLPHALLWEELARSTEAPWNAEVVALGVEPTSAPHGLGTAIPGGTITLMPGHTLSWGVELSIEWSAGTETQKEQR
ncbi:MAG: hypothetical protein LH471_03820 [Salinibacterium sp.]|nr:hypothetical protein [Salinibacterium sp.]